MTCCFSRQIQDTIPGKYHALPLLRAVLISGVVIGALAYLKKNYPIWQAAQSVSTRYWVIGGATGAILSAGAFGVIYRTIKKTPGKFTGSAHWESAAFAADSSEDVTPIYIDRSGGPSASFYLYKNPLEHYVVALNIAASGPAHAAASLAYNVLRIFIVPFFLLVKERSGRRIPGEMLSSFRRAFRAPFYGMAVTYAALYALVDPLNGRKLIGAIEQNWNEGRTRSEGVWLVWPGRKWRSSPTETYYVAGCCTPMGVVEYEEGKASQASSTSGIPYTLATRS